MAIGSASALCQDMSAPEFSWNVPQHVNIARACVDDQRAADTALIVDDGAAQSRFTFGDLTSLSRRFAQALSDLNIGAGDRVGVMVPQGVEVVTAHLGSFRIGAVTVPLSVKFGPEAVAYRLAHSGARLLVIDAESYERVRTALGGVESLHTVLVVGSGASTRGDDIGLAGVTVRPFDDVYAATELEHTADTESDSPAIIIYTSGTTGRPKGALHGHRILPAHMPGVRTAFMNAPQPDDVFWTPADWAWIGGLFDVLFTALAMGCRVVATPGKFTAEGAVGVMRRHRVTAAFVPPTALKQMRSAGLTAADTDGLALRILATGGETLGAALRDWIQQTFATPINEFYGQTEINMVMGTRVDLRPPEKDSMGSAFPGFEIGLLDSSGSPVDAGEVGEICVRAGGPGQLLEYWRQPDATAEKVHDGWIHTGDLARRDAAGNVFYEGRADDIISTAGYRVGPGEIEECLLSHPSVAMAAAVGTPDELRGEAIHAFVVLAEGEQPSDELSSELQRHVKSRLAFYQYPRQITFRSELPLTTTGKIMRRELRASLVALSDTSPR
jgi:acetyl-CoA synthetase